MLELQQIIGRGRGLWRTADNPLHVLVLTDVPLDMPVEELTTDAAERPRFADRQIAVGAIAFECAAHAAKAFPEKHGRGQPAGTIAWQYRIAGQGERSWRVYAPPHMTADAVQACAVSILGPLASFERTQPKGAFSFQSEAPSTGNSRDFGADDLPERPLPFMWQAWKAWRVEHPPDG